ncbi:MAG: hypothetical protein LBR68_01975 [Lachnoclostridium sp.]|jgi:hypothetical protein|nr:hypothetical protein [Lachnoclostridium sp.]
MKRLKTLLIQLLHPRMVMIVILTTLSGAAVIASFAADWQATPLGYVSYVLSAYALIVLIINLRDMVKKAKSSVAERKAWKRINTFLYSHTYSRRYLTDISYRIRISLLSSLGTNLLYAAVKLISGIYYASFWYGADAIYYIVLSVARVLLTRYMRKDGHSVLSEERNLKKEYRVYRSCGILLFVLNAALTGVVYQIAKQNMGYSYPGLLIYVVATYTFVILTVSIVNVVKFRKMNSPVFSAVKLVGLAKALVAVFALQSAMFASFNERGADFERLMNSIFGGLVCLSIFAMAVIMVTRANNNLKKLSQKEMDFYD